MFKPEIQQLCYSPIAILWLGDYKVMSKVAGVTEHPIKTMRAALINSLINALHYLK